MKNIVVFASGSGTNFEAIVDACEKGLIDAKVVLMVCDNKDAYVIERAKNHSFIIKVFCIFHKNHPNSILLLVGDGTLKSDIKKLVDTFELTSSVIFLDKTSAIANAMMAMDVFVMPSLAEGLGIVAIEAQTTGLPIVVSNGVPSEAHVTDRCCALSLDMPPIVWSEKLYELLSISCESRLAYSKRVYDKGYDIKTVSEQMMHIFLD